MNADLEGLAVATTRVGDAHGEPIIVIPGGPCRGPEYLGDLAGIGDIRPLVILHPRGTPRSGGLSRGWWADADDVAGVIDSLGLAAADLIAHSAGTRLALATAARFLGRVRSMALVTPPASWLTGTAYDGDSLPADRDDPVIAAAISSLTEEDDSDSDEEFRTVFLRQAPASYAHWTLTEQAHAVVGSMSAAAAAAWFDGIPDDAAARILAAPLPPALVVGGRSRSPHRRETRRRLRRGDRRRSEADRRLRALPLGRAPGAVPPDARGVDLSTPRRLRTSPGNGTHPDRVSLNNVHFPNLSAPPHTMDPAMPAPEDHAAWRAQRRAAVTAPTGNLALVETRWTGAERPDIAAEQADAAASVTVTPIERTDISTGAAEYGLRVWDADAPAIRAFDRIDAYDYDPDWVLEAQFTPVDATRTVPFEHIRDNGGSRELVVPGDISFTLNGVEHHLAAFDDGGVLLLVFGDATNGSETYGSGRFLFVRRDDDSGFGAPGAVILDFNRAFVPPCGFSAQYNCPLPPAQNRFTEAIRAGEKNVVFTGGFDIYSA